MNQDFSAPISFFVGMNLRELISSISRSQGWEMSDEGDMSLLDLALEDGRHQKVRCDAFRDDGHEMARFTSRIGSASELDLGRCRKALEVNARLPHGCLAIMGDYLVVTETRPLGTTTPESSARAIGAIARLADTYEKYIYGTDDH